VLNTALSGVDMALWDLKGKRAGLPVYELLGGRTRDYATVYNHCGAPTVEGIVENCRRELDRGIDHLRVNVHSVEDTYLDTDDLVEGVLAVRRELGSEPELLIDVHGRATPAEVTQIAKRLEPADLFFLEDPLRPENKDTFERLRNQTSTPLAMGELFTNPWEMVPLIENEHVDYIRTDLAHVGGITAADKLAAVGEHHYVETAFHAPGDVSPIGQAATVHVDLSVPNFGVQELCEHATDVGPDVTEVFEGGAFLREGDGGLDVPDEPGLGIDVDEDAAAQFEYERSHLPTPRDEDGSVRDW
jgi:mannonate dehydratase